MDNRFSEETLNNIMTICNRNDVQFEYLGYLCTIKIKNFTFLTIAPETTSINIFSMGYIISYSNVGSFINEFELVLVDRLKFILQEYNEFFELSTSISQFQNLNCFNRELDLFVYNNVGTRIVNSFYCIKQKIIKINYNGTEVPASIEYFLSLLEHLNTSIIQ